MEAMQDLIQLLNTKDKGKISNDDFIQVLQNAKTELLNDIKHYNETGESKPLPQEYIDGLSLLTGLFMDIFNKNKDKAGL